MPIFKIPVNWEVYGIMEVEAPDIEEAIHKVEEEEVPYPSISDNTEGSIEVNFELIEFLNKGIKISKEPEKR
jgi:hypothetical protein